MGGAIGARQRHALGRVQRLGRPRGRRTASSRSGLDVTMVGLDVTHRAMLSAERAEALRATRPRRRRRRRPARLLPPVPRAGLRAQRHAGPRRARRRPRDQARRHRPPSTCRSRSTSPRARAAAGRSSISSSAPASAANAHVATDVDAAALHRPPDRADRARLRVSTDVPLPAPARRVPAAHRPHGVPRLGAEPGRRSACASAAPTTRSSRPASASTRPRSTPTRATTTSSCSTARRCPTRARAGSRDGLRGPSRIVDPLGFEWTDGEFRTPGLHDA